MTTLYVQAPDGEWLPLPEWERRYPLAAIQKGRRPKLPRKLKKRIKKALGLP